MSCTHDNVLWHAVLCRALVNEADAAVARLVAEKTYKRPQIWEVPENADRLEGIGATDK